MGMRDLTSSLPSVMPDGRHRASIFPSVMPDMFNRASIFASFTSLFSSPPSCPTVVIGHPSLFQIKGKRATGRGN